MEKYNEARSRILNYFNGSDEDWIDWRWQLRRRISTVDQLSQFVDLTDKEKEELYKISSHLRWALSPYYMALVMCDKPNGGVWLQSIPSYQEITDNNGSEDPMAEGWTSPLPV